jgi:F0F1-type ATP synthase gamma subunit
MSFAVIFTVMAAAAMVAASRSQQASDALRSAGPYAAAAVTAWLAVLLRA